MTTFEHGVILLGTLILFLLSSPALASEEADSEEAATTAEDESTADGEKPVEPAAHPEDGFHFGTYGRVQASSDFDGRLGDNTNIVAHGARLMEGPYVELDFGYTKHTDDDFGVRVLTTLALFGDVLHYTGEVEQLIALRNLYAEVEHFLPTDLRVWIGSRMYRGDDVYLLDFWPLDNLNTYGGGVQWDGYGLRFQWHMGVNRLLNKNNLRTIQTPATFGADEITVMERQKLITSLKATYFAFKVAEKLSLKASLYGEFHHLPTGEYEYSDEDAAYFEQFGLETDADFKRDLPADNGFVVGAQLGLWDFSPSSHLNLFFRYARDLAAYGEWALPWGLASDRTTSSAQEFVMAYALNWESHSVGLLSGGYARYFEDADAERYDLDDYWEGILSMRPAIFVTRHYHQMFEISHQWKRPNGLAEETQQHLVPQVVQLSVIPALSLDRGMYQRPQLRLVYTASYLNGAARQLYPAWDSARDRAWHHFFGAQAEWWLDSATYKP